MDGDRGSQLAKGLDVVDLVIANACLGVDHMLLRYLLVLISCYVYHSNTQVVWIILHVSIYSDSERQTVTGAYF